MRFLYVSWDSQLNIYWHMKKFYSSWQDIRTYGSKGDQKSRIHEIYVFSNFVLKMLQ